MAGIIERPPYAPLAVARDSDEDSRKGGQAHATLHAVPAHPLLRQNGTPLTAPEWDHSLIASPQHHLSPPLYLGVEVHLLHQQIVGPLADLHLPHTRGLSAGTPWPYSRHRVRQQTRSGYSRHEGGRLSGTSWPEPTPPNTHHRTTTHKMYTHTPPLPRFYRLAATHAILSHAQHLDRLHSAPTRCCSSVYTFAAHEEISLSLPADDRRISLPRLIFV
jgi:hypothetical protein